MRPSGEARWIAVAGRCRLSPLRQPAADPNKVLRVAFEIAETGFDPAKVTDNYSSR